MQLENANADDDRLLFCVEGVKIVRLYFVDIEQNGWLPKYSSYRVHSNLGSAKAFCEESRVQGTWFYIRELPSLALTAGDSSLLVSDVSATKLFERFSLPRLRNLTAILPASTMTLQQMLHVFGSKSPLWRQGSNASLLFSPQPQSLIEVQSSDRFAQWVSTSHGSRVPLSWGPCTWDEPDCAFLNKVASVLEKRLAAG